MAVLALPTFSDPFYSYTITLEGKPYLFEFRYNQRESAWYLDVAEVDGTVLVRGVKLVCGINLLRRFADVRLPPGLLTCIANGADKSTPGLEDLGEDRRVTLTYFTTDEIEAT